MRTVVALFSCIAIAACSDESARPGNRHDLEWRVDSIPVFDVADTSIAATPMLHHPRGATRLSNGVVAVADDYAPALRYFSPAGHLIRSAGRRGQGPGEFTAIFWLGQCGADSVYVFDYMLNRMTVFDSAGSLARQQVFLRDRLGTFRCSQRGKFAVFSAPREPVTFMRPMMASLWIGNSPDDSTAGAGVVRAGVARPLGAVTQLALSDRFMYVGTAESAFVDIHALTGERVRTVPVGVDPRRPSQQNYEAAIEAQIAVFPSEEMRADSRAYMRGLPMPEYMPSYFGIFVDPEEILWIVLSAPGDSRTKIRGIGPSGSIVADLDLPVELNVFEIGTDYILGSYEDTTGVPHVALYRLHRGPG
jgi:hypothetical protein